MRRRKVTKRELIPDVKFNSPLVARLINTIMSRGKKSTAQSIVYGALDIIGERKKDMAPIDVFTQALENVKPKLEVKSRRVGGATYQVPIDRRFAQVMAAENCYGAEISLRAGDAFLFVYGSDFGSRWLAGKLAYKNPAVSLLDEHNWYLPFK